MRLSLIAILFISLLAACGDDTAPYKCTECTDSPEANAAYDNTGQGIYKGVLIGSSGTIKFDIANNGTTITAVIVIDGKSVTLTASGTYLPASGFQGGFSGTLDGGTIVIPFNVSNTGTVTIGTPTIPGHPDVIFGIYKEKSNQIVQAFEGTYTGGDGGTFNLVFRKNEDGSGVWYAISRPLEGLFQGELGLDSKMIGGGGNVVINGTVSGDNVKGQWTNGVIVGTWKGKRTL
jgi:hypothetical protein